MTGKRHDQSARLGRSRNNNTNVRTALKSSGTRAQQRKKKIDNHIQEPGTYRSHHEFEGPTTI